MTLLPGIESPLAASGFARFLGKSGGKPAARGRVGRLPPLSVAISALFVAAPLFAASPSHATAEDVACAMFTDAARTANAQGPVAVNGTTTQQSVSVSCDTKTIETRLVSTEAASALPQTWQADSEKDLSAAYCSDPA